MKIFKLYKVEELQEGLGNFDFLRTRSNYNKSWTQYKHTLKSRPSFPEDVRSKDIPIGEAKELYENSWYLMLIHVLELPLVDVPLYMNSFYEEVKAAAKFRMENGR